MLICIYAVTDCCYSVIWTAIRMHKEATQNNTQICIRHLHSTLALERGIHIWTWIRILIRGDIGGVLLCFVYIRDLQLCAPQIGIKRA